MSLEIKTPDEYRAVYASRDKYTSIKGIFQRIGTGTTFDPLLERHFFQSIEKEANAMFERKHAYLKHMESELGRPDAITRPDGKALHDRYTRTRLELDVLAAFFLHVKHLTDAAINHFARIAELEARIAELEARIAELEENAQRSAATVSRAFGLLIAELKAGKAGQPTATVHPKPSAAV